MGERTDDLEPQNEDIMTSYERSQERAGRNQELMRERLGAERPTADETGFATVSRADYIVDDAGHPEPVAADTGSESTAEIRGEIEDTRARLGSTIDAIQDRLSPQNVMDQAKQAARDATIGKAQEMASNVADTARETGSTLMDTIRSNPVPVALTAVGLGWLLISARREASERQREREYWNRGYGWNGDRYRLRNQGPYDRYQQPQQDGGRMSQMADRMQDTASKVGDQVRDAASNVSDRLQDTASGVADRAGEMADYAQYQAQRTRGWLEETWNDNPLLMLGAVVGLGAIVGLALPETQMENQLMGETRDTLVQKAQGVAQESIQKAQNAATEATDQVKQQAQSGKESGTAH